MNSFVTDTRALVKFMMGKKVINDKAHQVFLAADKGEAVIIIPAIVLMEVLYLFEKHRIGIGLLHTDDLLRLFRRFRVSVSSPTRLLDKYGQDNGSRGVVVSASALWAYGRR
jgi:predicted nucleic acid-binding protein